MDRVQVMLDRLPPVYRTEGASTLRDLLSVVGLHLATFDEDLDRVQRSHWVDQAFELDDVAKLGELFELPPAVWEPLRLYRTRLKATVAARLQGSVTRLDLDGVLARILDGARDATGARYLDVGTAMPGRAVFRTDPGENRAAFVEFPARTRRSRDLAGPGARITPLDVRTLVNQGVAPVPLELVVRGMPGGLTAVPLVANLTNGSALGFAGVVRAGQELRIGAPAEGGLSARLDGTDVADRIYTTRSFHPGEAFEPALPDPQPMPIVLERGPNRVWFLSLALYDAPGLDAAMMAIASEELRQGVFAGHDAESAGTGFDASLFHQGASAVVDAWWEERAPASFRFDVPAGAVLRVTGRRPDPELDRGRLFRLLQDTVDLLRAAAVDGRVDPVPLRDEQRQTDRGSAIPPAVEEASSGQDHLAALGALFDLTATDGSRLG